MSLSNFAENELLDALLANGSYVTGTVYVSLHDGDPGETGANEASGGSYTRQTDTFSAASGGSSDNDSTLVFSGMPAGTWTHAGLWDASSGGNFLIGGALNTSRTTTAGDAVWINAGDLDVTLS